MRAQLGEVVTEGHVGKTHRNFGYKSHLSIDVTPDGVDAERENGMGGDRLNRMDVRVPPSDLTRPEDRHSHPSVVAS